MIASKVVVLCGVPYSNQLEINDWTHANNIPFITADTRGLFGYVLYPRGYDKANSNIHQLRFHRFWFEIHLCRPYRWAGFDWYDRFRRQGMQHAIGILIYLTQIFFRTKKGWLLAWMRPAMVLRMVTLWHLLRYKEWRNSMAASRGRWPLKALIHSQSGILLD